MELLGEAGADDEKAVRCQAGDREVPDDAPGGIEHRCQAQPPGARNAAGKHAVEPAARPAPADLVLAVVGRFVESHGGAHRLALRAHDREGLRAAVGRGLARGDTRRGEPQRVFQAEVGAHDRSGGEQLVVDRRAAHRPRRRQLLVRIGQPEAPRIVLGHLDRGVLRGGEGAEPCHVHRQDVLPRVTLGHPARQHQADAAALAEAGHHRARHPVVRQAAYRADQRVAVGGEGERPVHRLADARAPERREVLEADLEVGRQALEVLRQQLHREVIRGLQR